MVTLGTGIGTAVFIDGQLVPNTELGHIEIDGKDAETPGVGARPRAQGASAGSKWGKRLNRYFQELETLLNPDLFIVGGGVSKKSEKFFGFIHTRAELVPAQLLNEAGIVGAAVAAAAAQEHASSDLPDAARPARGARRRAGRGTPRSAAPSNGVSCAFTITSRAPFASATSGQAGRGVDAERRAEREEEVAPAAARCDRSRSSDDEVLARTRSSPT